MSIILHRKNFIMDKYLSIQVLRSYIKHIKNFNFNKNKK